MCKKNFHKPDKVPYLYLLQQSIENNNNKTNVKTYKAKITHAKAFIARVVLSPT